MGYTKYSISKLQAGQVSQMLYDQYCQEWFIELDKSNKLDALKLVNKVF